MKKMVGVIIFSLSIYMPHTRAMHFIQEAKTYYELGQKVSTYLTFANAAVTTGKCLKSAKDGVVYIKQEYGDYITMRNVLYAATTGIGSYIIYKLYHANKKLKKDLDAHSTVLAQVVRVQGEHSRILQELNSNVEGLHTKADLLCSEVLELRRQAQVNAQEVLTRIHTLQEDYAQQLKTGLGRVENQLTAIKDDTKDLSNLRKDVSDIKNMLHSVKVLLQRGFPHQISYQSSRHFYTGVTSAAMVRFPFFSGSSRMHAALPHVLQKEK